MISRTLCAFPKEFSYGYLRFEGIFPFPSNLRQPQLSSFGKCKEKPGTYSLFGVNAMPLFLKNLLLKKFTRNSFGYRHGSHTARLRTANHAILGIPILMQVLGQLGCFARSCFSNYDYHTERKKQLIIIVFKGKSPGVPFHRITSQYS